MLKIAITGNIASGKSTVENFFEEKGYPVLDTDMVTHDLLKVKKLQEQIIKAFSGYDILENEEISRPKLGKIVFEDKDLRKKLENIVHPLVKTEIGRFFNQIKGKIALVSIPLLFETNMQNLFDKVILIYSDDKIRLERLMQRNGLGLDDAKTRMKSQMGQDEKIALADYVVYNNKSLEDLNFALNLIEKELNF